MTLPSAQPALKSRRGRQILLLLCAVAFLDFIDASITNVALPHILTSLNFSTQSLQWVPSAYLLTYGGFMLLGGRLADLLGRRTMMLTGTVHDDAPAPADPRRVLVIGRSPGVLLDAVALLRADGYTADATNQFDLVLAQPDDFDVERLDVVVFGGFVPPDTKEALRAAMSARNPGLTFVQGLAGMPGLIAAQVRGAFGPSLSADVVSYQSRSVRLLLQEPALVTVETFWATSLVPPEPKSTSAVVLQARLEPGSHEVALPAELPYEASFVAVTVDSAVQTFTVGPMPQSVTRLVPTGSGPATLPAPPVLNTRA